MTIESDAYAKHKHLKLAASELGIKWQTLYSRLRAQGVAVTGDKARYGSPGDKRAAFAEAVFKSLVPNATDENRFRFQSKVDFTVGSLKVDVKSSMPRQLNLRYAAKSWSFSFKKQIHLCDFMVCFCFRDDMTTEHILLVPCEMFSGIQTVSVSCQGHSKWLDYAVAPEDLAPFFQSMEPAKVERHAQAPQQSTAIHA